MTDKILKEEERVAFALRSIYKKYGYLPYKMSKFEEYDLYVANKEFLVGDGVITFNDTDGKLLALKPDVTLSIIKNSVDGEAKKKVYYNENVYRISGNTKQFKEIPQAGLECIGEIGAYDVFEAVYLAAASLSAISEKFVLDISHLGILFAVLSDIHAGEKFDKQVMRALAEKNAPALALLCEQEEIPQKEEEKLRILLSAYGKMDEVLEKIAPVCKAGKAKVAFDELKLLCSLLSQTEFADKYRLDFSVVNDMNYYDDIVFKGFIDGIADGVLSGGSSTCAVPTNDLFVKLNLAWNTYSESGKQLKAWLDPDNTSLTVLDGVNPYGADSCRRMTNLTAEDAFTNTFSAPDGASMVAQAFSSESEGYLYGVYVVASTNYLPNEIYIYNDLDAAPIYTHSVSTPNTAEWVVSSGYFKYAAKTGIKNADTYIRFDNPVPVGNNFYVAYSTSGQFVPYAAQTAAPSAVAYASGRP